MSRIEKWFTGRFNYDTTIDTRIPFDFPFLNRLFNTDGIKRFDNIDQFNLATLFLSNYVINADGIRKRKEISFIYSFFEKYFDADKAKSATFILDKYSRYPYDQTFYESILYDVNARLKPSQKQHLIYFLFELADADGEIDHDELNEIFKICFRIGISKKEMNRISALYISGYIPFIEPNFDAHYRKYGKNNDHKRTSKNRKSKSNTRRRTVPSSYKLRISLQVLGLTMNSSIAQIKAAYRKLAKANHPDQFATLGKAHVKKATEKMARINRAYEYIQSVKRFS